MTTELMMPSNHLILCRPRLLLPSIFPSIRVFSNESVLHNRWPKYWCSSFSISPSDEYSGLIPLGWTGLISLLSKGLSRDFSNIMVQKHQFFGVQFSVYLLIYEVYICMYIYGPTVAITRWVNGMIFLEIIVIWGKCIQH